MNTCTSCSRKIHFSTRLAVAESICAVCEGTGGGSAHPRPLPEMASQVLFKGQPSIVVREYLAQVADDLLTEEAKVRYYKINRGPESAPESPATPRRFVSSVKPRLVKFTPPSMDSDSLETHRQVKRYRECGRGSGTNKHTDMALRWKNNAAAAEAPRLCAADKTIRIKERLHSPHAEDGVNMAHTHHLYREVGQFVNAFAGKHGPKTVEVSTSNPHAKALLSKFAQPVRSINFGDKEQVTYRSTSDQFHPEHHSNDFTQHMPPVEDKKPQSTDPNGHKPLTCTRCKETKVRDEFHNKTANLKLSPDHPAYGKKQHCKSCESEKRRTNYHAFRKNAIEERGGKCAHCGEASYDRLQLDHVHEHEKRFSIGRLKDYPVKDVRDEVKKTVPLCDTCNMKKKGSGAEAQAIRASATKTHQHLIQSGVNSAPKPLRVRFSEAKGDEAPDAKKPEDVIEPFNGLAVRNGEDERTIGTNKEGKKKKKKKGKR